MSGSTSTPISVSIEDWGKLNEKDKVEAWRMHVASELGYDEEFINKIGQDTSIDLGRLRTYVEQGCDLELAVSLAQIDPPSLWSLTSTK